MEFPLGLSKKEHELLSRLSNPILIQDFLDTLAINYEKVAESCMSPRMVLRERKAHCIEGAMLAASALWISGERPLLLELRAKRGDQDHAVALYKHGEHWGAISKTNHTSLRFRDPVYPTIHALVLSYFHEYFVNDTGAKTLRSYTRPFSLQQFGTSWITSEKDLWKIAYALHDAPHFPIIPEGSEDYIRPADRMERRSGKLTEWEKRHPRT